MCNALRNGTVTNIKSFLYILTTLNAQPQFLTIMPALIYTLYISLLARLVRESTSGLLHVFKTCEVCEASLGAVCPCCSLWLCPRASVSPCRPMAASGCGVVGNPVDRELRGGWMPGLSLQQGADQGAQGGREGACTAPGSLSHHSFVLQRECFLNAGPSLTCPSPSCHALLSSAP